MSQKSYQPQPSKLAVEQDSFLIFKKNSLFPITMHKEHQKPMAFNIVTPNITQNQTKQM